jgi:hypothetical protein
MTRSILIALVGAAVLGLAPRIADAQQFPILEKVAQRVVQKYQQSSCEQLAQERAEKKPKPEAEQKVVELLRTDAQMRQVFLSRVAAPIADKLLECGLIP